MKWTSLLVPLIGLVSKVIDLITGTKATTKVSIPISNKEIMLKYAFQYLGVWYKWGGDDPSGFDCSGLANELLTSVGLLPRGYDTTADGLWNKWPEKRVKKGYRGCLVFWESSTVEGKAVHVEIMINDELAIGASGGGSNTLSISDAITNNAFIKIRTVASRDKILGYVDPFK